MSNLLEYSVSLHGQPILGLTHDAYITVYNILYQLASMTTGEQEFSVNSPVGSITFKINGIRN